MVHPFTMLPGEVPFSIDPGARSTHLTASWKRTRVASSRGMERGLSVARGTQLDFLGENFGAKNEDSGGWLRNPASPKGWLKPYK